MKNKKGFIGMLGLVSLVIIIGIIAVVFLKRQAKSVKNLNQQKKEAQDQIEVIQNKINRESGLPEALEGKVNSLQDQIKAGEEKRGSLLE